MTVRVLAVQVLSDVVVRGRSLTEALATHLAHCATRDRALLQQLCYGTLRYYPRLQAIVDQLLHKKLPKQNTDVALVLYVALYQLLNTRIPAHAAIHSAVESVLALKKPRMRGLVNALLRRFEREKADIIEKIDREPVAIHAHPKWLLHALQQAWPEAWPAICEANNTQAGMSLRVNLRCGSRDDYLNELAAQAIEAFPIEHTDSGVTLAAACAAESLPGFTKGQVSVQDGGAQLAAELLAAEPGQRVLDACAAPGGKTCHILEKADDALNLIALDISEQRLAKVGEALQRLHLHAELKVADVAAAPTWWDGVAFDRILLDVPCSATGVIRRHPDIKLLRRASDIAQCALRQQQILQTVWPMLKPGGRLVYSTCSILPQENDQVITEFCRAHPDAKPVDMPVIWGVALTVGQQLLPGEAGMDGFYYAVLEKKG